MSKIIIPTDFSEVSKNATVYGFFMAEKLGLSIELVHVLEIYKFAAGTSEAELISTILPADNIIELEQSAAESFEKFISSISSEIVSKVSYTTKVISGNLVNEMVIASTDDNVSAIIIAVPEKQDLATRFTNNTISAILNEAVCPVITVPSAYNRDMDIKNVIVAIDFNKAEIEMIQKFISLFCKFNPLLIITHISQKQIDFKTELKFAGIKQMIKEKINYDKISYVIKQNKNIVDGILDEITKQNANMLLMLKEHEGFFKSLFESSKTEKITHYLKIPMISYRTLEL